MKLNEITNKHAEIEALLKKYRIKNYTIHPDGTVDVDGDVDLRMQEFTNIPFKFSKVRGNFFCKQCPNLTSLIGAPSSVDGSFICDDCPNLTSLDGAPSSVDGSFSCDNCKNLTSLKGAPAFVGEDFYFRGCRVLTSLEGFFSQVAGGIICSWHCIESGGISLMLSGCPGFHLPTGPFLIIVKYLGRPDDIFECQTELIEAGYEAYARL